MVNSMIKFHPHPVVGITKVILMAILLSALIYLSRNVLGQIHLTLLALLWAFTIIMAFIAFIMSRTHTLTLEENSLTYHSGIISTKQVVLPYSKITESSYTQTLIQRLFGVGTLKVDSAGGSEVAIFVHDIREDNLKKILAELNKSAKQTNI